MAHLQDKKQKLQGVAQALVMGDLLEATKAQKVQTQAKDNRLSFVQYLVENNILEAHVIAQTISRDFGVPLLDLDTFYKETIPLTVVSEKLIHRHNTLPLFKRGENLYLAVEDPSNQVILSEIKFHTGLNTHCVVVESHKLANTIKNILSAQQSEALSSYMEDSDLDNLEISADEDFADKDDAEEAAEDAPVVRFVHKILLDAVNRQASDIHFEPYEKFYRIRFRVDGILYQMASPPINLSNRIAARLKVMSRLDISERRLPQDGRFKMKLSQRHEIDFRVSTCPTINGEKIVMRILDPMVASVGIENIGFNKNQTNIFTEMIKQPYGMILVTGPTGSGKTVTLYTALNILNTPERNISTAEDPVEIKLNGVNQVHINNKVGLTFASTLRSFLRQDPDVIMVGEMRDLETAEIGIKAAQTGHLVLSTLHTNNAPETLTRLVNMNVPPFNIASSVIMIIAQRLARRLCKRCKEVEEIPQETLLKQGFPDNAVKKLEIYKAVGCDYCTDGYKGRVGLFEVMAVTPEIGDIIMRGGNSLEIKELAIKQGMISIRQSGLEKITKGLTSLAEINRVTKD